MDRKWRLVAGKEKLKLLQFKHMLLPLKPHRQQPGHCGPASLKIVMDYYGTVVPVEEIAQKSGCITEKGTSAAKLIQAAKSFGFKARKKDFCTLDDLKECLTRKIPAIVDWFSVDDGHYSVVAGLDEAHVYLQDPELGDMRTINAETFTRIWFDFPGDRIKKKSDLVVRRCIIVEKKGG